MRQANQAIYEENVKEMRSGRERMGTTLVMILIRDNQAAVVHVGDSRLYTLTLEGELTQITADHEVGQRDINRGIAPEVAYSRPDAYQLTQALGPRPEEFVEPDIQFVEFYENTLVVLGSDGLTDNDFLETHTYELENLFDSSENLEEGADRLIELANAHNGHDNITAILIRIGVRPF
ncbi:MAG: SpoIIE family protein phosphatase [Coleofasciculaceae cyanobacterium SM2_3_26]|nr:SpoIIE family protein phosphatase [Coleofasciculaceae cyanobacterium SM2_3_26]